LLASLESKTRESHHQHHRQPINTYYLQTMTRYSRKKGARTKKKGFRKSRGTKRRSVDIDQIQDELKDSIKAEKVNNNHQVFDPDLPGGGLFYCVETGRHFADQAALDAHKTTKGYKKRCKLLKEEQYTQAEADAGAGLQTESYQPWGQSKKE
jgi:bud site selection protein 20